MHPPSAMRQRCSRRGRPATVRSCHRRPRDLDDPGYLRADRESQRQARPSLAIEHSQHMAQKDFARYAKLGVIASVQPYHAIDDGRWAEEENRSRPHSALPTHSALFWITACAGLRNRLVGGAAESDVVLLRGGDAGHPRRQNSRWLGAGAENQLTVQKPWKPTPWDRPTRSFRKRERLHYPRQARGFRRAQRRHLRSEAGSHPQRESENYDPRRQGGLRRAVNGQINDSVKLRSCRPRRGNEIFRFVESKPFRSSCRSRNI